MDQFKRFVRYCFAPNSTNYKQQRMLRCKVSEPKIITKFYGTAPNNFTPEHSLLFVVSGIGCKKRTMHSVFMWVVSWFADNGSKVHYQFLTCTCLGIYFWSQLVNFCIIVALKSCNVTLICYIKTRFVDTFPTFDLCVRCFCSPFITRRLLLLLAIWFIEDTFLRDWSKVIY